jgi:hypothetical protein
MTPKEFFDKVVEMRRCQKEYFKNKRQIDLRISKQIEREVDEEIELIAKNDPKMCQRLIQAEKSVGHSFFPPLYIPQRFCKNKQYPYVEEVLEYVKEHTPDMFEPEGGYACMSLFHGLCE